MSVFTILTIFALVVMVACLGIVSYAFIENQNKLLIRIKDLEDDLYAANIRANYYSTCRDELAKKLNSK